MARRIPASPKAKRSVSALRRGHGFAASVFAGAIIVFSQAASADESGISFWVPGFFGSLAATPQQPGFAFAGVYYHETVHAGGDVAFARQVTRGNITANFSGNVAANLDAKADLFLAAPSYVF